MVGCQSIQECRQRLTHDLPVLLIHTYSCLISHIYLAVLNPHQHYEAVLVILSYLTWPSNPLSTPSYLADAYMLTILT